MSFFLRPDLTVDDGRVAVADAGNDVVLGPTQAVTLMRLPGEGGAPAEQAVHWQRLRPGSGFLNVRVVMDGPTRVLQITDFLNRPQQATSSSSSPSSSVSK